MRSVVLDSAYPTYGESAWYPTQGPAMRDAFTLVCERSAACRSAGRPFLPALRKVLSVVRAHPWHGVSHDADGTKATVTVDGPTLTSVAFGATFGPPFYREMTAALRSGLRGDHAPLLRLVAEAIGGGTDAGDPVDYSEGLDAAVACHDYPQLYDMTASPSVRTSQYAAALDRRTARNPFTYGPFTIHEYADSDWQELDWCTRWPAAPSATRPVHRGRRAGTTRTCRCSCSAASSTRSPRPPRAGWSRGSSLTRSRCSSTTASTSPPSGTPTTVRSGSCAPSCGHRVPASTPRCGAAPATSSRCEHRGCSR